jgi:hypothetical protein
MKEGKCNFRNLLEVGEGEVSSILAFSKIDARLVF